MVMEDTSKKMISELGVRIAAESGMYMTSGKTFFVTDWVRKVLNEVIELNLEEVPRYVPSDAWGQVVR